MAEYESERLGVKFTLPDQFTVRQQLTFRGGVATSGNTIFIRLWDGAKHLFENWECEKIPDPIALDLDETNDPAVADIVQWCANTVSRHLNALDAIPKND